MTADYERFATVGLDEILERAALLTRTDRKYVLPIRDLPAMLDAVAAMDALVLRVGNRAEQVYRTVYYDTPTMDFYRATALGRRCRSKVRVRSYLPDALAPNIEHFLEVKTRSGRGATIKRRFPHADDGYTGIDDYELVDACLSDAGLPGRRGQRLSWTVATHYRRATLVLPCPAVRVTVDCGLSWSLPDGRQTTAPDVAIIETKSPTPGATDVDRLLWTRHRRPYGLSKFGLGLAMLRPELPANRWAPVLRRYFGVPRPGQEIAT